MDGGYVSIQRHVEPSKPTEEPEWSHSLRKQGLDALAAKKRQLIAEKHRRDSEITHLIAENNRTEEEINTLRRAEILLRRQD